jgi:sugar phosphate isomerase/epimerase
MTQVIAVAVQEGGMPIPRGGGARLVDALVRLISDHGGTCETGRDVETILVDGGSARGVRLADGTTVTAARAVIANVTPTQLYGRLLPDGAAPVEIVERGRRFRYGRSEMQIHLALSEPPRWDGDERLGRTAIVHLTPGLDGVSRAVNEAKRGQLPAEATVVVGQPLTIDPSRAPEGAGLLWVQLQELPWHVQGDAAGELDPGDGTWTEALRERYADRIQARIARHVTNLDSALVKRVVLSPADLQAANVNLHHGDPYSGSLALDQNFLWRPFAASPGHSTRRGPPLAHRCEHAPRARPRRGLRHARRAAAARAAAPGPGRPSGAWAPAPVRISISEITTVGLTFAQDLDAYRAAGASGIGIWETKLADDSLERFRAAGLEAAAAVPAVPSILPLPLMEGPEDPAERVEAIRAGIRRLAPFEPACVLFLTGPGVDRATIVEGIRAIAEEGRRSGVRVALEPIQREFAHFWTVVSSLGEAAELIEEADANVGLLYDVWHLWNQPLAELERFRDRILGVHVADWREPTRNTNDRVLPGDGTVEYGPILDALRWDGLFDLEIFSDPDLPGSLWRGDAHELARRGVERMREALSSAPA